MKHVVTKSIMRAQQAPGNAVAAIVATVTSAVTVNPLPLILWVLGSGTWTLHALTSRRYVAAIADEERAALVAKTARERTVLRQRIERVFATKPFWVWITTSAVPDYLRQFDTLLDLQRRIAQVLRTRGTEEFAPADRVLRQLDTSLTAYLKFVWARIAYLQQLTGQRVAAEVLEDPSPTTVPPKAPGAIAQKVRWWFGGDAQPAHDVIPQRNSVERTRYRDVHGDDATLDCTAARRAVEQKIADIRTRVAKAPEAARATLTGNVKLLEKLQKVLEDVAAADAKVAAQIAALHDAFELILNQVSATQFDASGIVEYMDTLATEVQETERFVAAMQPTDDTFGMDLPMLGVNA